MVPKIGAHTSGSNSSLRPTREHTRIELAGARGRPDCRCSSGGPWLGMTEDALCVGPRPFGSAVAKVTRGDAVARCDHTAQMSVWVGSAGAIKPHCTWCAMQKNYDFMKGSRTSVMDGRESLVAAASAAMHVSAMNEGVARI
jgi:hypothetical protein